MPARTLPVTPRTAVSALAGLLAAFLVAFVLTDPPGGRWAIEVSDRELDRWLGAQPTGIVVGVGVAVAVCVALQRSGSRRLAWVVAAAATLPLGLVRMAVPEITGVDALISLHIVKCVAAGALLGSAVSAVWGHRGSQLAVVVGAVTGFLSVPAFGAATSTQSTSTLGEPSWWLLAVTVAAAIAAAAVADTGSRIPTITAPEAGAALLTIGALAVINRAQLAWIGQSGNETRTRQWVIIAVAMVVVLVATVVCARFVARRTEIADGVIVVAATGIAAAAMPALVDLRSPFRDVPTWSAVVVAGVAVVVGLVLAARIPIAAGGLGVAAVVPVLGAIWPDFGADGPWLLVRLAVVGVGAGWAVAATLPGTAAVAAAALSIPFVSYVFHAAATVIVPSSGEVARGNETDQWRLFDGGSTISSYDFMPLPHYDDRIAGIALALAVAVCAWAVRGLRAHR